MSKIKVIIAGASGQLGSAIKAVSSASSDIEFTYMSSSELDITNSKTISEVFKKNNFSYCINCAAYTNVDKAEEEREKATLINEIGAKNLALICEEQHITLIHISTDFVFDGSSDTPYLETSKVSPIGFYGESKLKGEQVIAKNLEKHFIIRTAWLYSEFGNNFMKSMIRLGEERDELSIVNDQIGTPTYAIDLANVILKIITTNNKQYGIYHYSNEGKISWYDFAKAIFNLKEIQIKLNSIPSSAYPTLAKRPHYSVLDKTKIKQALKIEIPFWKDSLQKALQAYS